MRAQHPEQASGGERQSPVGPREDGPHRGLGVTVGVEQVELASRAKLCHEFGKRCAGSRRSVFPGIAKRHREIDTQPRQLLRRLWLRRDWGGANELGEQGGPQLRHGPWPQYMGGIEEVARPATEVFARMRSLLVGDRGRG